MTVFSKKTPFIEDETGRRLAGKLIEQIHRCRGLVSYLETHAGINGKYLKLDMPPKDMDESRIIRILVYKARWQGREEFMQHLNELGEEILKAAGITNDMEL